MRDEYSIERGSAQIYDSRTKEYFREVSSCYASDNYRSSVVMLWSVAICDLLFKLQELAELYKDEKAKNILSSVEKMQKNNRRSSGWEIKLLDLVVENTELLDESEYKNLCHLQQIRHLAAHPAINQNWELYNPNKDTTFALIRNTLEGLLIKMPLLSKKVFTELVKDLENKSKIPIDDERFKLYLDEKYYERFNPEVQISVFKDFWKFLFKLEDENCEKNRDINYRAFLLLFSKEPTQFQGLISKNKKYFSQIAEKGSPIIYLVYFLSLQSDIYELLNHQAKIAIEHTISLDSSARCLGYFTVKNKYDYVDKLNVWICEEDPDIDYTIWNKIQEIDYSSRWRKKIICLANTYYGISINYNTADRRFDEAVRPLLENYDTEDIIDLMEKVGKNNQTWQRARARTDHEKVVSRMRSINPSFDFKQFEAFSGYDNVP